MTLALLCQFTAQHVSDINTYIFRSLRLLGALLCRLYCGKWKLQNIISSLYCKFSSHFFHASHGTAATRSLATCWAVNWHNKQVSSKLVYFYSNIKMMHGPIHIRFTMKYPHYKVTLMCMVLLSPRTYALRSYDDPLSKGGLRRTITAVRQNRVSSASKAKH